VPAAKPAGKKEKKYAKDSLFLLNWQATANTGHVDALRDQLKVLEKVSKDAVVSRHCTEPAWCLCSVVGVAAAQSYFDSCSDSIPQDLVFSLFTLQWFTVKEGPNGMQQVLMVTNDAKKVCALTVWLVERRC
jgi:hypothetical protein